MASSTSPTANISSAAAKLSLETSPASKPKKEKKNALVVAESWEDEEVSSGSEAGNDNSASDHERELDQDGKNLRGNGQAGTAAPPPTPMSPTYSSRPFSPGTTSFDLPYNAGAHNGPSSAAVPGKRPEKTDAVARRMIASALGVKVPKQTEEQKQYDRAMREKERATREREKELQRKKEEEAAKARQAVWED